jgi:hypothetical protein
MTLRADYFDNSTGIQTAIANAVAAGSTFVTTNLATLSSGLQTAAAQGKTTFTVTIATSYQTTTLRLNTVILEAYLAGITQGLADQLIYDFECTPTLNTSDNMTTSINFNFDFSSL